MLRLENLDTDIRPPQVAVSATIAAAETDSANSYLPFQGARAMREVASAHVGRISGRVYDPDLECLITAGGLNGVLNALLATVEPGQEVVVCDPIYAGLVNRIRLAGGVPRFVPYTPTPTGWTIDPDRLAAAVGPKTAVVLMMSPAMPTGAVLNRAHWNALAEAMASTKAWLLYDAAMERIRFDDGERVHPASIKGLAERTISVGAASKELRMIGWRVGWVVGPKEIVKDINLVGLSNVVCQVGIAQNAVAAALSSPEADDDLAAAVATWKERSAFIVKALDGYPVIPPDGGWSLLIDTRPLGMTPAQASEALFTKGAIAATGMNGWGPSGEHYLRFVFANESVTRMSDLRSRVDAAWGGPR
ncbi:pyridoxal phosphate-dependent aminotransferase [Rhodococcus qingshengii]|uniref:pyridoxal phosphate-dependent aminotransferase n=1 Tax=Rhodococcus qingshengii TaxID=334542 RepID=UPI001B3B6584|nr:pyridoxal phosphate-dependent aminotransferase [Rhodococcus qingshengii]